ncbi:MAG TPA: diaminopimelate epimerase [Candidatus Tyrphobacter sp.]
MEPKDLIVQLVKMHGARNDFIIADARREPFRNPSTLAIRLCDRRVGIGADGLLLLEASAIADARMRVFNADGSEAEMCGNGIRCLARYLDEAGEGSPLRIETETGVIETRVVEREPEYLVRVTLPVPDFSARRTGATDGLGMTGSTYLVRVGNPHLVLLRGSIDDFDFESVATELQREFPEGINVHVTSVSDEHTLRVRHWERGVGLTQACGTGAVACAASAIRLGLARSPVDVHVPGGNLHVEWDGTGAAYLTGPAERVFDAVIPRHDP